MDSQIVFKAGGGDTPDTLTVNIDESQTFASTSESTRLLQGTDSSPRSIGSPSPHRHLLEDSNAGKLTWTLIGATLAALISTSAQFGYAVAMLNNIRPVVVSAFQGNTSCSKDYDVDGLATASSQHMFELATSAFCVGGLLGSVIGGWAADALGRKYTMLANNVFAVASGMIMHFSLSWYMLIGGRFVQGFVGGIGMVVVAPYLAEIAPTSVRGAIGILNQLTISTFIFVATVLGLPYLLGTCRLWRFIVSAPVAMAALQLVSLPFFPRSPRFLYIDNGNAQGGEQALRRLRGERADISHEVYEMRQEKEKIEQLPKLSVLQVLTSRHLRFRLVLTAIIHMSQQFTGINGVFFYGREIYKSAGLQHVSVFALLPAVLNVVVVLLAVRLVERLGRRSLMLVGLAGMSCSYVILTAGLCFEKGFFNNSTSKGNWTSSLSIAGSLGVVIFFSIGPGPVPWMIVSEIFPQNARATAYAFAGVVNWGGSYLVGQFFLDILQATAPYGFCIFGGVSLIFAVLIYYLQPETKNLEIADIDRYFRRLAESDQESCACFFRAGKDTAK